MIKEKMVRINKRSHITEMFNQVDGKLIDKTWDKIIHNHGTESLIERELRDND